MFAKLYYHSKASVFIKTGMCCIEPQYVLPHWSLGLRIQEQAFDLDS